jgi:protein-S-isoprenylcysteine O-methyltransferase Ste14
MAKETPITWTKVFFMTAFTFAMVAGLFFIPAGTIDWPEAWAVASIHAIALLLTAAMFMKTSPELVKERLTVKGGEKGYDKIFMLGYRIFVIAMYVSIGLDKRFAWSALSSEIRILGFASLIAGIALCMFSLKENAYASKIVKKMHGQKVVSTGLYSLVRHPMYAGGIVFFIAIPFAMGSFYSSLLSLILTALLIYRTYFEDKTLQKELKGYKDYAKKTKYKLIPYVW